MPNSEEQRLDIIENCNVLLQTVLLRFEQTDETPEGRMIAQLKWIKERAENRCLLLPVDADMLSTLLRVYTDGDLCRHASSPDKVHDEIEIYLDRLIRLTKNAELLFKLPYYRYAIRCVDALLRSLKKANRPLSKYEQGLVGELHRLRTSLVEEAIEPPLDSYFPNYTNFRNVYSVTGSSVDDLPESKLLIKVIANLIFNGVRPNSWITLEAADKETSKLL